LVSPVGIGTDETWEACRAGVCGIDTISQFDPTGFSCQIAGEVKGFDPFRWIEKKEVKKMGRFIQMGIAAADFAVTRSRLRITDEIAERAGVYVGSGIGGFEVIEREHRTFLEKGPGRISPFFIPGTIINLCSGHISIRTGAKGPNSATATACTTSTHAIGDSFKIIQRDDADVMICGGAEAAITPMSIGGFAAMRALSHHNSDPKDACRPWDSARDGFVVGEGAGVLVIEELQFAKRRGAPILAEIVGYGMSGDAYHITSGAEDGEGIVRVMRNALRDARLEPHQIDYVNAHATSTEVGDRLESMAIETCFGQHARKLAVSSTKSMTGHLLGGAGGLEAGITLMAMRDQVAPPTINFLSPGRDCNLDYVPNTARSMRIDHALSNSFGFGGTNGSLIFARYQE
jgi:3-oxoacyl-[acyl-carrier-protein] synthase II